MVQRIFRGVIILIFFGAAAILGHNLLPYLTERIPIESPVLRWILTAIVGLVGALIGTLVAPGLTRKILQVVGWLEARLQKMPTQDIVGGAVGLIIGLIIAYLLTGLLPLTSSDLWGRFVWIGIIIKVAVSLLLGYLGLSVGMKKKEELLGFLPMFRERATKAKNIGGPKVLDTSVIIDGRIADLCQTGFVEGSLVIPSFVLEELRHIADSSDLLKRNRGRRGLDILNKIRKEFPTKVQIVEKDFDDLSEVDSKLVRLAQVMDAKVFTNDFNLNKVAELQGVQVLNINELANAVKPVVLPGEEMTVQVIKDGKEAGQGVAYLDDGTMIVVDSGKKFMGQTIGVMVTSVLQTSAGRMIFAKPKGSGYTDDDVEVNVI